LEAVAGLSLLPSTAPHHSTRGWWGFCCPVRVTPTLVEAVACSRLACPLPREQQGATHAPPTPLNDAHFGGGSNARSSTGRAVVSKTTGSRFESWRVCETGPPPACTNQGGTHHPHRIAWRRSKWMPSMTTTASHSQEQPYGKHNSPAPTPTSADNNPYSTNCCRTNSCRPSRTCHEPSAYSRVRRPRHPPRDRRAGSRHRRHHC